MLFKNLGEMFFDNKNPDQIAYKYKKSGQWISVDFKEAHKKVEQLAAALYARGIKNGDKVAIMSNNRIEWSYTDYATVSTGAILVPIYPTLLAEHALYILNNSEAKVLIVSDSMQATKIDTVINQLKFTKDFYMIEIDDNYTSNQWQNFDDLYDDGKLAINNQNLDIREIVKTIDPESIATIIYTSGTTGEPKGSMLTHKNFLSNIESAAKVFEFYNENDMVLSFLPLSHVLERMAGHYQSMYHGVPVAYAESIEQVPENLLEIQPTLFVSVPRLYEKIYAKVIDNVESGSALKRKIFYWSINVGKKYIRKIMNHQHIPTSLKFKREIAFKLVFKKLSDKLGGKIRFMVSGGAPLSAEIGEFFGAAGLYILEGYGLTETSPAITINQLNNFRYGTVGPILPDVEVKIAEDGEILSRGNHIMKGYYKNEAATNEVIDSDKWFHTGDIGLLDDDGFLVITDRKKNILVTSGGKNIAPQPIENLLTSIKYIEQAVVIGDRRNYCTAIIVIAEAPLKNWAKTNNIKINDFSKINSNEEIRQLFREEIDKNSVELARYETIKDFYLTDQLFTIENNMLTPTMKIKRKIVEDKFADEIDQMYHS